MKPLYTVLSTIIFAVLSVAVIYFARGLWDDVTISSAADENLELTFIIISEYYLISGLIISLVALKKKGFHNLKDFSESGLIWGLTNGLVIGVVLSLISWLVGGVTWESLGWLIYWMVGGLLVGLLTGWGKEFETNS